MLGYNLYDLFPEIKDNLKSQLFALFIFNTFFLIGFMVELEIIVKIAKI